MSDSNKVLAGRAPAGRGLVKNRAPAQIQITAEQLLVESRERAETQQAPAPRRHVADPAELAEHRLRVRKEFEDHLRRQRYAIATWLRYAKWEDGQGELVRARSVYERALEVDFKHVATWIRYAEMEMRARFMNRARNVLDRAVGLLPRIDALWLRATHMEEMLGNVAGARVLFERWMTWEPVESAWLAFANFEMRAGEPSRARAVYERVVATHPSAHGYIRYAKWEERAGQLALARRVFEVGAEVLTQEEKVASFYEAFASFEERCNELARARVILKIGADSLPAGADKERLHAAALALEKQHGSAEGIESTLLSRRRATYAAAVASDPLNYDVWFDWLRLEESEISTRWAAAGTGAPPPADALASARDVYEQAIAAVPPVAEKRFWRRYIYFWLYYAVFEELVALDSARARAVLKEALRIVPHQRFTFAKLWLAAAQAEVRARDVTGARKLLGVALGLCPKRKILTGYLALENALGEVERVRKLTERGVQLEATAAAAWLRFADLEKSLGETERARAIFDLALAQPVLDSPELVWKTAIDFEIENGDLSAARELYSRLLSRSMHVKVFLSWASFEWTVAGDAARAREIYKKGVAHFKAAAGSRSALSDEGHSQESVDARAARALLIEAAAAFEQAALEADIAGGGAGDATAARTAAAAMPRQITRRRPSAVAGPAEYVDFIFPDDDEKPKYLKVLEAAAAWKAKQLAGVDEDASATLATTVAAGNTAQRDDVRSLLRSAVIDENEIDLDGAPETHGGGAVEALDSDGDGSAAAPAGPRGTKRPREEVPTAFDKDEIDIDADLLSAEDMAALEAARAAGLKK